MNPNQKISLSFDWLENETCHLMNFAVLVDHKVQIKVSKNIVKYSDLARKQKKSVEHMGVTVMIIALDVLETVLKELEKGIATIGNRRKNREN